MNPSFPWLFPDSLKIPWLFPDFLIFFQNSLTFPWLEKVISFFQVFQCRWEPCTWLDQVLKMNLKIVVSRSIQKPSLDLKFKTARSQCWSGCRMRKSGSFELAYLLFMSNTGQLDNLRKLLHLPFNENSFLYINHAVFRSHRLPYWVTGFNHFT